MLLAKGNTHGLSGSYEADLVDPDNMTDPFGGYTIQELREMDERPEGVSMGAWMFRNNPTAEERKAREKKEEQKRINELKALIQQAIANNVPPENMARNDSEYREIIRMLEQGQGPDNAPPTPTKAGISNTVLIGSVAGITILGMILSNLGRNTND